MWCTVFVLIFLVFDTGTCKNNKLTQTHPRPHKNTTIKYYTVKQTDIRIPIMMHIDKALTRTLPKEAKRRIREKFKLLAKDILKDVEEIYSRPNLHQRIKLELLDVKIIKNNSRDVMMSDNVSEYLKSYCSWQGEKKATQRRWFYSVLFTGLDLYYLDNAGNKMRRSTGRGYMKGVCSNKNSCTLLEWHPDVIAHILAHEMAHSLGIPHDTHECRDKQYIMDARYSPRNPAKTWSPCNKKALHQFLKTKHAWCLQPVTSNIKLYSNSTL